MPHSPARKSPAKAHIASKRPRDSRGHFMKLDRSSQRLTKTPKNSFAKVLNITENKTADDETLVDVKVTNPLRKISSILEQIRRRQATVIDFKFTIPLVALPIFMLLAFSLGRGTSVCGDNTQTRIGVLYALKTTAASESSGFMAKSRQTLATNFPFLSFLKPEDLSKNRMILIQRDNTTLSIENGKNSDLTPYHTRQVFVTGKVNSCANTLEVANSDDVQLLP